MGDAMGLITLRCDHCGGEVQLDDSRDAGFCMYCGTKIVIRDDINQFYISNLKEQVANLKKLMTAYFSANRHADANKIADQIISINGADAEVWFVKGMATINLTASFTDSKGLEAAKEAFDNYSMLSGDKKDHFTEAYNQRFGKEIATRFLSMAERLYADGCYEIETNIQQVLQFDPNNTRALKIAIVSDILSGKGKNKTTADRIATCCSIYENMRDELVFEIIDKLTVREDKMSELYGIPKEDARGSDYNILRKTLDSLNLADEYGLTSTSLEMMRLNTLLIMDSCADDKSSNGYGVKIPERTLEECISKLSHQLGIHIDLGTIRKDWIVAGEPICVYLEIGSGPGSIFSNRAFKDTNVRVRIDRLDRQSSYISRDMGVKNGSIPTGILCPAILRIQTDYKGKKHSTTILALGTKLFSNIHVKDSKSSTLYLNYDKATGNVVIDRKTSDHLLYYTID